MLVFYTEQKPKARDNKKTLSEERFFVYLIAIKICGNSVVFFCCSLGNKQVYLEMGQMAAG
jgi:hypothetical protein